MNLPTSSPLRIGARGSLLSRAQVQIVLDGLRKAFPNDPVVQQAIFVPITTTGDRIKDRPLYEMGGKGLFAKELEQSLCAHEIDIAVHSLKDMEITLAPGMAFGAFLEREDVRDVMINLKSSSLAALPAGSVIGTCAPRRIAQILHHRPDLVCVPLRGNVDTRIQKLREGHLDALILALAGLRRLGRQEEATYIFSESEMVPAVGQGTIALEYREDDFRTQSYLTPLNHIPTERRITVERSLLKGLGGNCRTPIGGHAIIDENGRLRLEALIAAPSGKDIYRTVQVGDDPVQLGLLTARILSDLAGPDLWETSCVF